MPKQAFPAAAEGMPNFNRRTLLRGMGSAAAVAGVVAAPAVAEAMPSSVRENPELIRLGQEFPAISAEYIEADEDERAIIAEWSPRWPSCPEVLHCGGNGYGGPIERNMVGAGIMCVDKYGQLRSRSIQTAVELQSYVESADRSIRRAKTQKSRDDAMRARKSFGKRLSAAIDYERECAHIREVSGYTAAYARRVAAEKRLLEHIAATLRERAETTSGVVIQAKAVSAAKRMSPLCRAAAEATSNINWSSVLAASILRVAAA